MAGVTELSSVTFVGSVISVKWFTMWWSCHQFVKGSLGQCVPFQRARVYLAAAISVVVSSMRLEMWIVVGSEVMVRRPMHNNMMVWVLYVESVSCDSDHVNFCFSGLLHVRVSRVLILRNKYTGRVICEQGTNGPHRFFTTPAKLGPYPSRSIPTGMLRTLSNIIFSVAMRSFSAPSLGRSASIANNTGERVLAIALGSNLGDKVRNIETALRILETQHGIRVVDTSFLYESHPMYMKDQPPFVNGACLVSNSVSKIY